MNRSSRYLPEFDPHPLLRGGNRQTIVGCYLPSLSLSYSPTTHEVALSDDDRLLVHDQAPPNWQAGDRIVALFHGLGGSHQSPYVMRTAHKLRSRGLRTISVDMRGYGAGSEIATKPGHAGRSEDAAAVVEFIAKRYPTSPLTLVGFSLGGNVVLKLLGELGETKLGLLDSCWAASPPMQIARCAENMRLPTRRLYSRNFVKNLLKQLRAKQRLSDQLRDLDLRPTPKYIDEFDNRVTAPLSGFRDVHHYYSDASSAPLLRHIRVPTQIIAAEDDPIVPIDVFENVDVSSCVELHTTPSGGHLGYVGRKAFDPDRRWLDWRVVDWVLCQGLRGGEEQGK